MIYKQFSDKDFWEAEKAYNECGRDFSTAHHNTDGQIKKKLTRSQYMILFIAFISLTASVFFLDITSFFISIAFLLWFLQKFFINSNNKHAHSLIALCKSLSITLFVGSLILIFL